jgi:hypothetical protein
MPALAGSQLSVQTIYLKISSGVNYAETVMEKIQDSTSVPAVTVTVTGHVYAHAFIQVHYTLSATMRTEIRKRGDAYY